MKAADIGPLILIIFVAMAIFIAISLGLASYSKSAYENTTSEIPRLFNPPPNYVLRKDIFVLDKSAGAQIDANFQSFFSQDGPYCQNLKNCIKKGITTSSNCEITQPPIATFTSRADSDFNPICSPEDLTETFGDLTRKICTFKNLLVQIREGDESNSNSPDTDRFFFYEPNVHNCNLDKDFVMNINAPNSDVYETFYFYPSFSYVQSGQRERGKIRIIVQNATAGDDFDRTCNYNLFVCVQRAFASSEGSRAFKIFDVFITLKDELKCCGYLDPNTFPKNIKLSSHFPDTFTVTFNPTDERPNLYEVVAAMDAGLKEWNKVNFDNGKLIADLPYNPPTIVDIPITGKVTIPSPQFNKAANISFSYAPWDAYQPSSGISFSDCQVNNQALQLNPRPTVYYSGNFNNFNALKFTVRFEFLLEGYDTKGENGKITIYPHIALCSG